MKGGVTRPFKKREMITLPSIQIAIPSDFKIKITSITDDEGNTVDVTTRFIGFSFFVGDKRYDCISDPVGGNYQNAVIEDGTLYLVFEGYDFGCGRMSYVQHQRFADLMYTDHTADWYSRRVETNIFFVR